MAIYRVPVELTWPGAGSPGVNVWHVRTSGAPEDPLGLQDAVDAVHTFYNSNLGILAPNTVVSLGEVVEVQNQTRQTVNWADMTRPNTGAPAPPVLQVCVSWRTTLAARRGMGRTFIGPLVDAAIGPDGTVDEVYLSAQRTACQALVDASTALNDWGIAIYGLDQPAPPGADPSTLPRVARDIVDYRVRDRFSVLRSRRD